MTTRNYTFEQIATHLLKTGEIRYEIEHFGSSMDNPRHVEIAVYEVTLQGSLIATELDRFDYEHDGPPEPFPDPVEVLRDLTDFSVYQYKQKTRDGFTEGVQGFIAWIQEYWWENNIAPVPRKKGGAMQNPCTRLTRLRKHGSSSGQRLLVWRMPSGKMFSRS